jgi:two-component system sensor histidine kinase MprB
LTLLSAIGIAVVLVVGAGSVYLVERHVLRGQVDDNLAKLAAGGFVFVGPDAPGAGGASVTRTQRLDGGGTTSLGVPKFGSMPVYIAAVDTRGRKTAPGIAGRALPVPRQALEIAASGRGRHFTDVQVRGVHLRMLVAPARRKGQALLIAQSLAEVDSALDHLAWTLGITGLAGILLAAGVGAAVAHGALRPVRRLTATAERVAETHDLRERIAIDGHDEISRLAGSFDSMLDSLEGAVESQRQLVANASHELRTPLASLRTNIDVLRQGTELDEEDRARLLRDVGDEIEELTTLVANLVELARGAQRELHLTELSLDGLVRRVVGRAEVRFPAHRFELACESTTVWGEADEIERAVWNLLENAAKWSGPAGRIEVRVEGGEVSVRDFGPGVDAADRPHVFERFYRSEDARSKPGSGLGLAIVRQVAESHGGRVQIDEVTGGGARFRLSLLEAV